MDVFLLIARFARFRAKLFHRNSSKSSTKSWTIKQLEQREPNPVDIPLCWLVDKDSYDGLL